ncbi:MAG: hypothetical protein COB73_00805 [Flavobacteriaceae bacterium]|nr:MAG: hypothetical protein COB73_00805 [Flavobacteriaceae bacterium]
MPKKIKIPNWIYTLLRSIRYKIVSIFIFKITVDKIENWLHLQKKLFQLWWYDAPKYQRRFEKGNYLIRKATMYQVGQPFKIKDLNTGKIRTRYIDNLLFNFKLNKVTHKFSDKPIKGFSEPFLKPKKK